MTPIKVTFVLARQLDRALAETMFLECFGVTSLALGWQSQDLEVDSLSGVHPRAAIDDAARQLPPATFVLGANRWEAPAFLASGRVAAVIDRFALVNWARRGGSVGFWIQGLPELVAKLPAELGVATSPVVSSARCCTFGSARTQLGLAGLLAHYLKAISAGPET